MERHEQAAYKSRLLDLRRRLIRDVDMVEEALRQDVVAPGDISTLPTHPADMDIEGVDEEIVIAQNEEQMLEDVEAALERLEDGTYGRCQDCGREIPKQRLQALPHAPCCIGCARQHGLAEDLQK